ncbi:MAG TPA: cupredoxin domain-containing protein [Solirubrobacteraceae bacterium]|nr:cupredoxin domain-containing protein [Solirubrobacteraceae bacterium]
MSPRTLLAAALAALPIALLACGDDDVFRTDRPILRLALDEYRIVPQHAVVEPGRMKFTARNTGRLTHDLVVEIPDGPGGKPIRIARVPTMQPGETGEPVKVTLKEGEYRLVCTIANHDDLGQYGKLEVRE